MVLVSVGANDCIHGVPLRVFERRLDELVARLMETGALIVLSGVGDIGTIPRLKPPLSNLMSRRSARFNRAHERIAEKHGAHVVPHRRDDPTIWYTDRGLWSADLFHVSAAGHERWADSTWRTIQPLLDGAG
jgi:lysophospholipase L1-like esterase